MHPSIARAALALAAFTSAIPAGRLAAQSTSASATTPAVSTPTARARRAGGAQAVEYTIAFPNAAHHEAEVTATFRGVPAGALQLRMSRSSPGRYALHEFAKNVYSVRATDSKGKALTVDRPNPHQWDVRGHDGTVRVSYTLFGDRGDGTYAGIDRSMAHLNIPATFMWARGFERRPLRVTFDLPDRSWSIATQLFPTADSATFTAPDLQYFMDSPTHLGRQSWHRWTVQSNAGSQEYRVALHHLGTAGEESTYVDATKRIVEQAGRVFGEYPRYDGGTYTFIAAYLPWAAGDGMEHRNSTSLTSTGSLAKNMDGLLGTVSHEFFHSWNVERMRPKALEPFDFEEANMSGELWLAEGFTSYYGPLVMRRAGVSSLDDFADDMTGAVDLVLNAPGRRFFSAIDMSRQAPFTDAAVSIDAQNKANTFISYYPFGEAIALALDLTLRQRPGGRTLDDFMREMWRAHGAQRDHAPVRPYTLSDVRQALVRTSGDAAFANDFFDRYIAGKEAAPYAELLATAGLRLRKASPGTASLGDVRVRFDSTGATVLGNTLIGTPLYEAGVDRGDRIVSIDGKTMTSQGAIDAAKDGHKPGESVPIVYVSRGARIEGRVTFVERAAMEIVPFEKSGEPVTPAIAAFREQWLGRK